MKIPSIIPEGSDSSGHIPFFFLLFLECGERFFARFQAHEGELMRSPKVGNQGGETTFSSAFVDRTVQHSAWPIVRVDLPQVVCLGAASRNATEEVYGPLFDMPAPGTEPGSLD